MTRGWLLPALLPLCGCAGSAPLLYPAHSLPEGQVTFAAGTSGHFALGDLREAERSLDAAGALSGGARSEAERVGFTRGALTRVVLAPGVAPFVAARVGLGGHNEAGLSYTGRGARLDGRHAIEWPSVAISLGAAAKAAFARPGDETSLPPPASGAGLRSATLSSLSGYGFELPVVVGYRSAADVVKLWAGVRAGLERDRFDVTLVESPDSLVGGSGRATRYFGGGLAGFSVGLSPIEVRVELNAAYESIHGYLSSGGELGGDISGWSLTPAMAISAKL